MWIAPSLPSHRSIYLHVLQRQCSSSAQGQGEVGRPTAILNRGPHGSGLCEMRASEPCTRLGRVTVLYVLFCFIQRGELGFMFTLLLKGRSADFSHTCGTDIWCSPISVKRKCGTGLGQKTGKKVIEPTVMKLKVWDPQLFIYPWQTRSRVMNSYLTCYYWLRAINHCPKGCCPEKPPKTTRYFFFYGNRVQTEAMVSADTDTTTHLQWATSDDWV